MRLALIAAAFLVLASAPASLAQNAEMDAAEQSLRRDMAPAGVAVDRVAPNELRLRMPSDITFDTARANVRREFMPRVNDLARTLTSHQGLSVEIVGHADARGSDSYNQDLSERRARAVGAILMDYGVPRWRIEASGMGELEPIASNATDYGRAQNRRVEIRINSR